MPWRRPLSEPGGMPRRSSRRHLHPPSPRRLGRPPGVQWQEPARPCDDDRYSSFSLFFWYRGSLAVTLFFVEHPLGPAKAAPRAWGAGDGPEVEALMLQRGQACVLGGRVRNDLSDLDCEEAKATGCVRRLLTPSQYRACLDAQPAVQARRPGGAVRID